MRVKVQRFSALFVVCILMAAVWVQPAFASRYTIYLGKGVGEARLGKTASYNVNKLGKPKKIEKNSQYVVDGKVRTVYIYYWGTPTSGRYPLCMYALGSKRTVFNFTAYSKSYKTTKGIHVGSSEDAVKDAYPSAKRSNAGSAYVRYVIGSGPASEIWVQKKSGKVFSITVRK